MLGCCLNFGGRERTEAEGRERMRLFVSPHKTLFPAVIKSASGTCTMSLASTEETYECRSTLITETTNKIFTFVSMPRIHPLSKPLPRSNHIALQCSDVITFCLYFAKSSDVSAISSESRRQLIYYETYITNILYRALCFVRNQ